MFGLVGVCLELQLALIPACHFMLSDVLRQSLKVKMQTEPDIWGSTKEKIGFLQLEKKTADLEGTVTLSALAVEAGGFWLVFVSCSWMTVTTTV